MALYRRTVKKGRFLYLHPECNAGKVAKLDALQETYTAYLVTCVEAMINGHRFTMRRAEKRCFFPPCATLTHHIVLNVQEHAMGIVKGWAASKYVTHMRDHIKMLARRGDVDMTTRFALYTVGKHLVDIAGAVTQTTIDTYWAMLLDEKIAGKRPTVSASFGMRMCETTAMLATSDDTTLTGWWLKFSPLGGCGKGGGGAMTRRPQLPLAGSPHIAKVADARKGILARKDKRGRWRFEFVDARAWADPEPTVTPAQPRIGVDVGLNVIAATSDGRLLGTAFKPAFDAAHAKVKAVRANRQRQNLPKNSPRLDVLESKLTGMVKTAVGTVANQLVASYPGHAFVVEDLDLRGCRGSKRFAYRALHHSLAAKAPCVVVNPAYTSQQCPSCGYVSRNNRDGVKFHCRSCGRKGHADVVGGINLLGRSEDKQIDACEDHTEVKAILRNRYVARRNRTATTDRSEGQLVAPAPVPSGRRLTTGVPRGTGTALNHANAPPAQA